MWRHPIACPALWGRQWGGRWKVKGQSRVGCPTTLPTLTLMFHPFSLPCALRARRSVLSYAAAAAAKSLQSYPTLCDSIDGSPPGSPVPGILQARTLEWVAISFSNAWKSKVKGKSLNRFRPSGTPWTAAHQAPPSMGFSRQEYWSGVPLPSPVLSYDHLLLPWIPHPPTTTIITL